MNVVRPIAAPGKPAAATLGLLDCDIHPRPRGVEEYRPWLSAAAWERLQTYGLRPRHGFAKGYPFPKAAPLASRRDAWPPGGPPASNLDFVRAQHLDHYGIDVGILNPLQPSGQGDTNDDLSAAMAHAVMHDTGHKQSVFSLEIKVSFYEKVGPGEGRAEARVVRRGKRVAFLQAVLYNPEGKLAAEATSTGMLADL